MIYEEMAINASDAIEEYLETVTDVKEVDFAWVQQIILNTIDDSVPFGTDSYDG